MKKITVGFSKPKAKFVPFSWAIRAVLGTSFSHTYIKFKSDSFNKVLIYQASGFAVNFIGGDVFNSEEDIVAEFELEVSDEVFKKTIQFAIDKAGTPYGILQIFGILYVKAIALFGKKVRNPFSNGSGNYVCSELVGQILKEMIGLQVTEDLDVLDPKEVFELLQANNLSETL